MPPLSTYSKATQDASMAQYRVHSRAMRGLYSDLEDRLLLFDASGGFKDQVFHDERDRIVEEWIQKCDEEKSRFIEQSRIIENAA